MNYEFMQQVAPMLAIPPDDHGSWLTPQSDQPLYGGTDSSGEAMPLPYFQEQGGQRQFYSPTGTQGVTAETGGVQATANSGLGPIGGLRGTTSNAVAFNIPGRQRPAAGPQVTPPQNLMTPSNRQPEGLGNGNRVVLGIPPETNSSIAGLTAMPNYSQQPRGPLPDVVRNPIMGVHGQLRSPAEMDQWDRYRAHQRDPLYQGTRPTATLPPEGRAQPAPEYNPHAQTDRQRAQPNGANTLFDMFDQAGFRPPQFLLDLTGRGQNPPGSVAGRDAGSTMTTPVQDLRGREPTVQRTSSNTQWSGGITEVGPDQQAGRAEEVAAMLRANGIRVTSVTRQGNARSRGHPAGNSIDIDPNDQRAATDLIHTYYPGLAVEDLNISAGQDFGNGVRSTGHHGHIDLGPVAGPRRRR